jgi:hypothetical protein
MPLRPRILHNVCGTRHHSATAAGARGQDDGVPTDAM